MVAKRLNSAGIKVAGTVNSGIDEHGKRIGYNSIDFLSGKEVPFARLKTQVAKPTPDDIAIGRWIIFEQGLSFCHKAILQAIKTKVKLIIIDEIGPLELQGKGLKPVLDKALKAEPAKLIVVRSSLVEDLINLYKDYRFEVLTIPDESGSPLHSEKGDRALTRFNEEVFNKIYSRLAGYTP